MPFIFFYSIFYYTTHAYKGGIFIFYNRLLKQKTNIEQKIADIEKKLLPCPEGHLTFSRCGKYVNWYHKTPGRKRYIPTSERTLVQQLALKKYYTLQLESLSQELTAINSYLSRCAHNNHKLENFFEKSPEMANLAGSLCSFQNKQQLWANETYQKNPLNPEGLIHKTTLNYNVRSKSEVLITYVLSNKGIAFRYECGLALNGSIIYPDFTIKHPKTDEIYYWEHFGMMDSEAYITRTTNKLKLYITNGIIPSIQLITTYETKEHPLDIETVEMLVDFYFG